MEKSKIITDKKDILRRNLELFLFNIWLFTYKSVVAKEHVLVKIWARQFSSHKCFYI